jgi:hypothetical protein
MCMCVCVCVWVGVYVCVCVCVCVCVNVCVIEKVSDRVGERGPPSEQAEESKRGTHIVCCSRLLCSAML